MKKDNFIFQKNSKKDIKKKISILLVIFFIILIIFAFFSGDRNIRHYIRLKKQIAALEKDIAKLEKENKDLEEMIRLLNEDPYYIEKIAREELKKAKEDEIIIEFQNEEELEVDTKTDTD